MKNIKRQFGLHFDFHASNDAVIGKNTNAEDIEKYILDTQPDFIQCDSKGHPGISSYPTKVGTPANEFAKDNLKIWCETAKKYNIPIFVHHSGVWDTEYIKNHPEDAELDSNGKPYYEKSISFFGKYEDNLLIPQLKELISEYHIDGVWVDGEVWAVHRDYSENIKPYLHEGITKEEHNKIMREAFLRYVKKYVDELHAFAPDFKIMSNWLYSSYMPQKPEINVDYLSGDFVPNDSAFAARFEARCLAVQNRLWDLMAWSFSHPKYTEKPSVQLCQEAAVVLSLGGGFQIYITQNRDGSARKYTGNRLKEVANFVHARKELYGKKPLAQIGVLYSADSYYKKADVFNSRGHFDHLVGTVNAFLDAQYTVNIVYEYQLDECFDYELLVIPQWEYISDTNKAKLIKYAENGGKLVIIGAECCKQFGSLINEEFDVIKDLKQFFICSNDLFASCGSLEIQESNYSDKENKREYLAVCNLKKGNGNIYSSQDIGSAILPSYRTDNCSKGTITFIPFDFGTDYYSAGSCVFEGYLRGVINSIAEPFITTNQTNIDITLQENGDGIILNLINMRQSRHSLNYPVYDRIESVSDVELTINKPFAKVEMPLGETFSYETTNSKTVIKLSKLDIHSIVKISN